MQTGVMLRGADQVERVAAALGTGGQGFERSNVFDGNLGGAHALVAAQRIDGAAARHREQPGQHAPARGVEARRLAPGLPEHLFDHFFGQRRQAHDAHLLAMNTARGRLVQTRQRRLVLITHAQHEGSGSLQLGGV